MIKNSAADFLLRCFLTHGEHNANQSGKTDENNGVQFFGLADFVGQQPQNCSQNPPLPVDLESGEIKKIGNYAFRGCTALDVEDIKANAIDIGYEAFDAPIVETVVEDDLDTVDIDEATEIMEDTTSIVSEETDLFEALDEGEESIEEDVDTSNVSEAVEVINEENDIADEDSDRMVVIETVDDEYKSDIEHKDFATEDVEVVLQPIIENAYNYGLKDKLEGGLLRIEYQQQEQWLDIVIDDNGGAITEEKLQQLRRQINTFEGDAANHAMTNINRRLQLSYGEDYGVKLDINEAGGLQVTLRLKISAV